MPPQRRSNVSPSPKGRRPKIAGRPTPGRRPADPDTTPAQQVDAAQVESLPVEQQPEVETVAPAAPVAGDVASGEERDTAVPAKPVNRTSALRPRSSVGESVEDGAVGESGAAVAPGWRRVLAVGAAAVILGVFAVVAAGRPTAEVGNRAWVDTAETIQVTAAARNAIQTLYTYGFGSVDQDFDNARAVLTDGMRTQFDQTAQVTRDAVIQTKTETNAQVTDIGVKLLGDDRAELVASMNVSATNDGAAQGSAEGPLSVTMAKVGDTWLLADIRDR